MDLQFEREERDDPSSDPVAPQNDQVATPMRCASCQTELHGAHFRVNQALVCGPCVERLQQAPGTRSSRALRAFGFGLAAATVGSLVWYAVRALTEYEIGLLAIAIGFAVGVAVRNGSWQSGGPGYQAMAVALTYTAIISTYVPLVMEPMVAEGLPTLLALIIAVPLAFVAPILLLLEDPGGGLLNSIIIGVGLFEAWRHNKRPVMVIEGPIHTT